MGGFMTNEEFDILKSTGVKTVEVVFKPLDCVDTLLSPTIVSKMCPLFDGITVREVSMDYYSSRRFTYKDGEAYWDINPVWVDLYEDFKDVPVWNEQ